MKETAPFIDRQFHPEKEDRAFGEGSIPAGSGIDLYLHIPFCRQRCDFCSFPREIVHTPTVQKYVESLAVQANRFATKIPNPIESVYFGGGTPSVLLPNQLGVLMESVSHFNLTPGAQITLETRTDDITPEFLANAKSLGIGRFSVGVQTLVKETRQSHHLPETPDQVRERLETLMGCGVLTNIDLIYGCPGQTLESWDETLETVLYLKPGQISTYPFMLLAGTPASEHISHTTTWKDLYHRVEVLLKITREHGYTQTDAFMFTRSDLLTADTTQLFPELPHKVYKDLRREPMLGLGQGAFSILPKKIVVNPYDVRGFTQNNDPDMEYLVHDGFDVPIGYFMLQQISSAIPPVSRDVKTEEPSSTPKKSDVIRALVASQLWKGVYSTVRDWYTYSERMGFHTTIPTKNLPKNPKYQGN